MFFRGSRYEGVPEAEVAGPDGRTIRYKTVRLIPAPDPREATYRVRHGDRFDLAAHAALGDAEAYWRLCDLAGVPRPADLVATPGARIAVPAPGGGFGGGDV